MCRLLGIIASKEVDLEFSLERFKKFAKGNPDGWGIGWYEKGEAKIFKQGISADKQQSKFSVYQREVNSNIIISHVRHGTHGKPAEINSHPFKFKNFIFAHNGSVDREFLFQKLKEAYRKNIKGETDSEVYFYFIIQCIEEEKDVISGIKKAIEIVKKKNYTGLNLLLSDGENLFAYRDFSRCGSYYSLYILKRDPFEDFPVEIISKETEMLLRSKRLKNEKAVLICSEKLTKEKWEEIPRGCLLMIDKNLDKKSFFAFCK